MQSRVQSRKPLVCYVLAARGRLRRLGHHPWPPCDGSTLQVRVKLKPQTVKVGRGLPGSKTQLPMNWNPEVLLEGG